MAREDAPPTYVSSPVETPPPGFVTDSARERDNESAQRDREVNARNSDAPRGPDEQERESYARYQEWQRSGSPASQDEEKKDEEAPEGAFSHYLVLADGTHVRYDVGNDPYAPMPQTWNGMRVVSLHSI